ncbi:undecaprenyldiphospho-muramoylpentapeptide beta-N-acetylglucosaminyltransferase [Kordiimonas sp. SCSIO 12603]|uniref:undecaprenyldiphospho-muramoylpentapeptide beta-N-acetylglucosaminyltransferase n=1 Tax=Kordiimonas sp. SCSIO 12603 TaxID=2829596 RepID=UPI0021075B86|nr:undecaprenyldiphospho-muramoylpentapeptide beta-N-acetylglucosaminyltransferase [Kordiimonas sp. SCSIO 12603]UTW58019.1 undecaprenyldiphospho-muramoylpentapeptide beta-N-acetylglucosaminyltransferase [Kordiimonas sp. SCSIO 12603]
MMEQRMPLRAPKIILAAGGTGGHMMPAEAVADKLTEEGYKVSLITDKRGIALGNIMADLDKTILSASSHMGGGFLGKIKSAISLASSTLKVRKQFKKDIPSIVVGFGGYPSLPAVMAARSLGIPFVLHEQNAVLGRVNRMMSKDAELIALSVENTERVPYGVKTMVTGNPVRRLIAKLANIAYSVPFGLGAIRIFVIGGSQGARILSDVIPSALTALPEEHKSRLDIVHQARPEDVDRVKIAYAEANIAAEVKPYFDDVGGILLRTQLVICRSGASTLSELTAMGRPAILVPLKIAADDHQTANARIVEEAGGGWMMPEEEFTPEAVTEKLNRMFEDMGDLRNGSDGMRSIARLDAADRLADIVVNICEGEGVSA